MSYRTISKIPVLCATLFTLQVDAMLRVSVLTRRLASSAQDNSASVKFMVDQRVGLVVPANVLEILQRAHPQDVAIIS